MNIPATPPPTDRLLTVTEAAERLGTSRHYVYERINDCDLPTVQLGTRTRAKTRIKASDLQAFIDARTTSPEQKASA